MSKQMSAFTIIALCLSLTISKAFGQEYTQAQNRIKSIYTFNFMKDVFWPSFKKDGEITICMLAKNDLFAETEKLAGTRKIKDRIVKVQHIAAITECSICDMIFLDEEMALKNIKREDECTSFIVTSGFFEKGLSNIALMYQDKKLQFGINSALCDKLGYKVSTNLSVMANRTITSR
jgi:hypothetical protein